MISPANLSAALLCLSLSTQASPAQNEVAHAPDGGTVQRIQSLAIPPTANEPFSAVVGTEWTRVLPDGTTSTLKNHRTIARDSEGRIFEERRYFSPHGDTQTTALSEFDIKDPTQHKLYVCRPADEVCRVYGYIPPPAVQQPASNSGPSVVTETLGRKSIEQVEVIGSRETTTLAAGAFGNEKPQPVVKEFWFAPQLGINLITKRFDPRASAVQNFEVKDISLAEPNTRLFSPPAHYRLIAMDGQ